MNQEHVQELQDVVIRFSGDSGDGMQLTGTLFSDTSALMGNGISTFPDYPAEIRAPQGFKEPTLKERIESVLDFAAKIKSAIPFA